MRRAVAVGALLLAAGCIPEEGPMMDPGEDCLDCHGGGGAPGWSAAGTWDGEGRHVSVQDAAGRSFTIRTNQAGNFYTAEPLAYPIRVSIDGAAMPDPVPDPSSPAGTTIAGRRCAGSRCGCNDCHGEGGGGGGD